MTLSFRICVSFVVTIIVFRTETVASGSIGDPNFIPEKPMVYLKTAGGLGNQMFQYACAFSLAKNGMPLFVYLPEDVSVGQSGQNTHPRHFNTRDRTFALHVFRNLRLNHSTQVDNFMMNHKDSVVYMKDRDILKRNYPVDAILRVDDYCQSEKFFAPLQNDIRNLFALNISSDTAKKLEKVIRSFKESVSVHIRKGDFDRDKHRKVGLPYYIRAMTTMTNKLEISHKSPPTFFIFSDDIDSVKMDLYNFKEGSVFLGGGTQDSFVALGGTIYRMYWVSSSHGQLSNIEEFYLMTRCSHNIISTSSFGWWTAYLNPNPNKVVIAAKQNAIAYLGDPYHEQQYLNWYYPSNWTVLDVKYDLS